MRDANTRDFHKMELRNFFNLLDIDGDGELSRADLRRAAGMLGWSWREAPVFAVLDILAVMAPISENNFLKYMGQIQDDPFGPYGRVLSNLIDLYKLETGLIGRKRGISLIDNEETGDAVSEITDSIYPGASENYRKILESPDRPEPEISIGDSAVLIIDPQFSFTCGAWKRSIGPDADIEVRPIRAAFENCARHLEKYYSHIETMFTRCPFPPSSYEWDERLAGIVDANQAYFVKPGNSVLWPPANCFGTWIDFIIEKGTRFLVIGGCTLNSCVRVSAADTQRYAGDRDFRVIVDLTLSGARLENYRPSSRFGGASPVGAAIREMEMAGVWVARRVKWAGKMVHK